jgi:biotin transport system ATP-binding protein
MIDVVSLTRTFPGRGEPALDDVSFSVGPGECVVISGANGSGKSVLMHLIAGLDRPTSGRVTIAGSNGSAARVGLVFQDADAQILGDTPEEDVAFGPRNLGMNRNDARRVGLAALERVGLSGKEKSPARNLSGGEKRRLAVAGILAMDADIVIFDEPFANLDWPGIVEVNGIIASLKADGKTLIILTHELEKVLALANRLMVLFRGKLVYDGDPERAIRESRLGEWGIRNPIGKYAALGDLLWA